MSACACASREAPPERRAQVVEILGDDAPGTRASSLVIEVGGGKIIHPSVAKLPIPPTWVGVAPHLSVEFETEGLEGASGWLGLLPADAAAHQEVAFGSPGQPRDARARWVEVEIGPDGVQHLELPGPGPGWHAAQGVVVLELSRGGRPLTVSAGPRSEMIRGGRLPGGRAVLAVVDIERRPTRVDAPRVASGEVTLDGRLDEPVWALRSGDTLVHSRRGEPGGSIDAALGGPSTVWFAWDDEHLYVAASLPDLDLYAPHTRRDDPLYRDEALEVFLAADGSGVRYLEHQVSPRGVHFDARFPQYRRGDEAWNGSWRSAVVLDGDLEARGGDQGWTVELAFPWIELCADTAISCPPTPDQMLRTNVFRLDKPDRKRQVGLALSPTLSPDFHAWDNAAQLVLRGAPR